mgnify:CR=1 FL=1
MSKEEILKKHEKEKEDILKQQKRAKSLTDRIMRKQICEFGYPS